MMGTIVQNRGVGIVTGGVAPVFGLCHKRRAPLRGGDFDPSLLGKRRDAGVVERGGLENR